MTPSRSVDGGLDRIPIDGVPGALWVCGKKVVGPDPDAALARAGADLMVCLNERHELREYPDYPGWLEANGPRRASWSPIPDLHAPGLDQAREIVRGITVALAAGRGVVMHCAGGIGRAPTLAVCVLLTHGMAAPDAIAHVRAHRPMGGPEVGAQHDLVVAFAADVAR